MADLYVLEGGERDSQRRAQSNKSPHVPGIVAMPLEYNFMAGRSLWSKVKSVTRSTVKIAAAPVALPYTVMKSGVKATTHAVLHPSLKNFSKIVTNPAARLTNEVKSDVREAAHATAETGRFLNTSASRTGKAIVYSANVIRRMAKRAIKTVARSVLFSGDTLLGESVAKVSKTTAKALLMPPATAAVASNPTIAPAAPIVPVLVNEVIDELYSSMEHYISKGLSPDKAADAALKDLSKKTEEEAGDPDLSPSPYLFLGIGAGLLALFFVMKKRRK